MKKTLFLLLSLMLAGGFAYAQDSDSEEEDDCSSDDASYHSLPDDSLGAYCSPMLCLPLHYFPEGGAFAPHFADVWTEEVVVNGVPCEQEVLAQEPRDEVGPLNPLTTSFHIQGVHGEGQDLPIIFFAPANTFAGQLHFVDGARVYAVGPLRFGEGAYALVPEGEDYGGALDTFEGAVIPYNPSEEPAYEALNRWLLGNCGWYLEEGDEEGVLTILDEEGEVRTHYEVAELNDLWAFEYDLVRETYEESVFSEIDVLVQRVFWRFYRANHPEEDVPALWSELQELLDALIGNEDDAWSEVVQSYLENYRTLLWAWYNAFDDPRFGRGIYVPPSVLRNRAYGEIDGLLEETEDPLLWPTGRVTILEEDVLLGEPVPMEVPPALVEEDVVEVLIVEPRILDSLFQQILDELPAPVDTLLGARECWF